MMGNRGARGSAEYDAFSHRSRQHLHWRPGELRLLKRNFWKRFRKNAKRAIGQSH